MTAVLLALGSALTYGVADFTGGRVATRAPALTVTAGSQLVGLAVVVVLVGLLPGTVSVPALVAGAGSGLAGGAGLVVYFRALAIGPMGVVAPLTGAVGAAIPILVGAAGGERVGAAAVVGIVVGLVAVVLSSIEPEVEDTPDPLDDVRGVPGPGLGVAVGDPDLASAATPRTRSGPVLALLAGVAFGLFFVLLDLAPDDAGMWPLLGARLTSVPVLAALAVARRRAWPGRQDVRLVAVSGVLDVVANALFLLATTQGQLVLVGLLVSLYPVVIVLLARQVLGERLHRVQQAGCLLALAAVVLVSVG